MNPVLKPAVSAFFCFALQASSATFYSETDSADLSGNAFRPSDLGGLSSGENLITGVINEGGSFNPDAFSFTVAEGLQLTSLVMSIDSTGNSHFLALKDDFGIFSETDTILFAALVSSAENGLNLLETKKDGGNVAEDNNQERPLGVDLPLESGGYTLWFQETSNETVNYSFNLVTTPVPEPSAASFAAFGLLLLLRKRTR